MKRIPLAVLATALVTVPAPAVLAKAAPKCLTYTDAAGDSGFRGVTAANDPALDITKVRFSTVNKALVTTINVSKYTNRPNAGVGGRYQVTFLIEGKTVDVYWKNGPLREHEAEAFYQQGVRVNGSFVHDAVTGSVKENVITISLKLTMLKSAVGEKVEGVRAEEVRVAAMSSYVAQNETWDTATGPASGFVVGQNCR